MYFDNDKMPANSERERKLRQLQDYNFAAYDLNLYLNTHPNDAKAIRMHHDMVKKMREAKEAFESQYGPLTADASTNTQRWDWIDNPWPWNTL